MHQSTHEAITEFCLEKIGYDGEYANEIIEFSSYPDRVKDISVSDGMLIKDKHTLLNRQLCSSDHFCVPIKGTKQFNGLCWGRDKSIQPLELPNNIKVSCTDYYWNQNIFFTCHSLFQHPLIDLLKLDINKAFDEITYPTAAIMADRMYKSAFETLVKEEKGYGKILLKKIQSRAIGVIAHLNQDSAEFHHNHGQLLNGHSETEGKCEEWFIKNKDKIKIDKNPKKIMSIREEVERTATLGNNFKKNDIEGMCCLAVNSTVRIFTKLFGELYND